MVLPSHRPQGLEITEGTGFFPCALELWSWTQLLLLPSGGEADFKLFSTSGSWVRFLLNKVFTIKKKEKRLKSHRCRLLSSLHRWWNSSPRGAGLPASQWGLRIRNRLGLPRLAAGLRFLSLSPPAFEPCVGTVHGAQGAARPQMADVRNSSIWWTDTQ